MSNSASKIIDIAAKIFAVIIIVSIAVGVLESVMNVADGLSGKSREKSYNSEETVITENITSCDNLVIDIRSADINIKQGDSFSYSVNSEYIKVESYNNTIKIKEKSHKNHLPENCSVTLVIPKNQIFSYVDIDCGAGDINADSISCREMSLDLGAGDVEIDNLAVLKKAEVNAGAGDITVSGGSVSNLKCDIAAGNAELTAELLGNSSLDCAAGNLEVNLLASRDSYTISANSAIGEVTVDGNVCDSNTIGNGPNKVELDCALGEINVNLPKS